MCYDGDYIITSYRTRLEEELNQDERVLEVMRKIEKAAKVRRDYRGNKKAILRYGTSKYRFCIEVIPRSNNGNGGDKPDELWYVFGNVEYCEEDDCIYLVNILADVRSPYRCKPTHFIHY